MLVLCRELQRNTELGRQKSWTLHSNTHTHTHNHRAAHTHTQTHTDTHTHRKNAHSVFFNITATAGDHRSDHINRYIYLIMFMGVCACVCVCMCVCVLWICYSPRKM